MPAFCQCPTIYQEGLRDQSSHILLHFQMGDRSVDGKGLPGLTWAQRARPKVLGPASVFCARPLGMVRGLRQ